MTASVLSTMWGYAQHRSKDREAGGMLIGHHPLETEDIVLDCLTTPQPQDRRSRHQFHRDQAAHQELLDLQWILSGKKRTYVGEWHTHPEDDPHPSSLDLSSWKKAIKHTAFHGPGLLFIIVGRRTTRLWYGTARRKTFSLIYEWPTGEHYDPQEDANLRQPAHHGQSRTRANRKE
ncbi:Mov34/MPN/PAD-1 family protein [Deinococcus oregonensis]|uniref:Mov34/MPN/PAD-1 family protein n=1 Tax=Deinococcus oregonensis TaxID=1805970 RepID=A0ABV6B0J4_9DEIO